MSAHKQWVRAIFDRAAAHYGQKSSSFFNDFGKRLVEQVGVCPKQRVLDIATGRGAVLMPLAEAVGPLGHVVGIDLSEQMLQETSSSITHLPWVSLRQMDAEKLDFPDHSFDVVTCGFALFFFPDIQKALSECKRVLKQGGKIAFSIWGEDSLLDTWIDQETKKLHQTKSLAATPLYQAQALHRVLEEAQFNEIQVVEETRHFVHPTADEWWEGLWSHGTRARFEQLSSDQLAALREAVFAHLKGIDQGKGIPETLQVFYSKAIN